MSNPRYSNPVLRFEPNTNQEEESCIVKTYKDHINPIPNNPIIGVVFSSDWTDNPWCLNGCRSNSTKLHIMENGIKVYLCGQCCYDVSDEYNCDCNTIFHIDPQFGGICDNCEFRKKGLVLSLRIKNTLIMFKKEVSEKKMIIIVKKFREEILRLQNDMNTELFIEWLRCVVLYIGNDSILFSLLKNKYASLIYLTIFDALTAENLERLREMLNALTHPPITDCTLFAIYYNLFVKPESGEYVWKKE